MRNMKKIVMLISMLLLPILAGCAGLGGSKQALMYSNVFSVGNSSEAVVVSPTAASSAFNKGAMKQSVKGMYLNTADILTPILHDALKTSNYSVGEVSSRDNPNLFVFPDKGNHNGYTVSACTYLLNDSDSVVDVNVELYLFNKDGKPLPGFNRDGKPSSSKVYTERIFLDEVLLSGPDAQAKVNAALAQKYKNIVPRIVTDIVGLKLNL